MLVSIHPDPCRSHPVSHSLLWEHVGQFYCISCSDICQTAIGRPMLCPTRGNMPMSLRNLIKSHPTFLGPLHFLGGSLLSNLLTSHKFYSTKWPRRADTSNFQLWAPGKLIQKDGLHLIPGYIYVPEACPCLEALHICHDVSWAWRFSHAKTTLIAYQVL